MHLEEFIERLERGLGEGFGYRLNLPESKVEFTIDEDPTESLFEVTLEVIGNMKEEDVPEVIEKCFESTVQRLRTKAKELKGETENVTRSIEEVADDINRTLREDREDDDGPVEEGQGRERDV